MVEKFTFTSNRVFPSTAKQLIIKENRACKKAQEFRLRFLRGKQIALKPFEDNKILLESAENQMKDENKFLSAQPRPRKLEKEVSRESEKRSKSESDFFSPEFVGRPSASANWRK